MALMWCEARCEGNYHPLCHETSPGSFGVAHASKMAREAGWRVIDNNWWCPACIKRAKAEGTHE